jgi:DNA (cytosine-5)-methyltransferase 1
VSLIAATRAELIRIGKPWVIENVPGAPLLDPITLCGSMFGLGAQCRDGVWRYLRRHRLFESNRPIKPPGLCDHSGWCVGVYGNGGGGLANHYEYNGTKAEAQAAMGIHWAMPRSALSQAIPPAYTEWLGGQL